MSLIFDFTPPRHGWIGLRLSSGDQAFSISASHVPFDSIAELASAVLGFLESGRNGVARFNGEPEEYEILFEPGSAPGALRVTVLRGRGGRGEEVWCHEAAATQLGRTIWRALRRVESRFTQDHWQHSFPSKLVARLGALTAGQNHTKL